MVPSDVLEAAAALSHLRIPLRWVQLAGNSSPPASWSLSAWLTDLQNRHSHIERLVTQVCCAMTLYFTLDFFLKKKLYIFSFSRDEIAFLLTGLEHSSILNACLLSSSKKRYEILKVADDLPLWSCSYYRATSRAGIKIM